MTMGTSDRNLKKHQPMPTRLKLSWRYWKTPVLFGASLCILQILVAIVRFGGRDGWNPAILFEAPAILFGLALFFLGGVLVGLLVQRLLEGCTGAWRTALMVGVALATPFAVLFSLLGGLLGPPIVLIGTLILSLAEGVLRLNLEAGGGDFAVKKKRFSVEQIVGVLKQAEVGVPIGELVRQVGFSEQTF